MSKIDNENKERNAVEKLVKLFDVKSASDEETKIFNEISHDELCKAVEYWIDQTRLIFGEPVLTYQNQSLRDSGVDVSINLVTSKINFGFQVKSHGDIDEKDFSQKVNAQITQSKKHDLAKLVVALAGDLTDSRQKEKVRGIISEIKQQKGDNQYVIIIPPEKLVSIYMSYKNKEHPLKSINLDVSDAIKLTSGISESLSDERRRARVSLSIEYLETESHKDEHFQKFKMDITTEDTDLIDKIERMPITGEKITLDKVKNIKIFDGDKLVKKIEPVGEVIMKPTLVEPIFTIQTLSENNSILMSLDNLPFERKIVGKEVHYLRKDRENHSLDLKLIFASEKEMLIDASITFKGDVVELQNAVNFIQSLKTGKKSKFIDVETGISGVFDIPKSATLPEFPKEVLEVLPMLVTIQENTGIRIEFPKTLTNEEFNAIKRLVKIIETGKVPVLRVKFKTDKETALTIIDRYKKETLADSSLILNGHYNILGHQILTNSTLLLSKMRLKEDLDALYEKTTKLKEEELVELEMEPTTDEEVSVKILSPTLP